MVRLHMTKPTLCKASQEKSISAMQYWCRLVCVGIAVSLLALCVTAVDKGNFKTCDKSSFCRWALSRKVHPPKNYIHRNCT